MPIKNQFTLTPLFLNEPLPGLETLAKPDWILNRLSVPNSAKPAQLAAINERIAHLVASKNIIAPERNKLGKILFYEGAES
jgi:hypothetical protein